MHILNELLTPNKAERIIAMLEKLKTEDLSYKDIFNVSFEIYSSNIKIITILGLLIYIPLLVINLIALTPELLMSFPDDFFNYLQTIMYNNTNSVSLPKSVFIVSAISATESIVFTPLAIGGLTGIAIAQIYKGHADFEDVYINSIGKLHKIIPTSIIAFTIIMIGLSLFFVPGIYLGVIYSFYAQSVVVTGRWGLGALKESSYAVFGKWFKTLGFLILTYSFSTAYTYITDKITLIVFQIIPYSRVVDGAFSLVFSIFTLYFYLVQCIWFINKLNMFYKLMNKLSK